MRRTRTKALKLPPSPEIKRVLSAVQTIGLEIAAVEVEERCIRVFMSGGVDTADDPDEVFYRWKHSQQLTPK